MIMINRNNFQTTSAFGNFAGDHNGLSQQVLEYSLTKYSFLQIRSFLNHVLMTRITALSAGGDAEVMKVRTGSTSSSEKSPKGSKGRRGSATEEVLKAQAKRRGSSGEVFKGPNRQSKKGGKRQVVADKHTLHEAYYWLIETYVDQNDSDDQN